MKEWEQEGKRAKTFWYNKSICTILKYQSFGQKQAGTINDLRSGIILNISFIDGEGSWS